MGHEQPDSSPQPPSSVKLHEGRLCTSCCLIFLEPEADERDVCLVICSLATGSRKDGPSTLRKSRQHQHDIQPSGLEVLLSSRNNQEPSKKWVFSHPVPRVLSRWIESARILGRPRGEKRKHLTTKRERNDLILDGDLAASVTSPGKE